MMDPIQHHPIFSHFEPYSGPVGLDFHIQYLGDLVRTDIVDWERNYGTEVRQPLPTLDEEYFEWIDLLTSAVEADSPFTMLELGAGYGRWGVRAALAARRLGKKVRLGFAEAHPKNQASLVQTMTDNGISEEDYTLYPFAIGGARERVYFDAMPPEHRRDWFGQSINRNDPSGMQCAGNYYGLPLMMRPDGWSVVEVELRPLSEVLSHYDAIDLIDFDLQGAEADAIEEAIAPLTEKVKRLHIGTHGREVEERLRAVLSTADWKLRWDYGCNSRCETEYGAVSFVDGVQTWDNFR